VLISNDFNTNQYHDNNKFQFLIEKEFHIHPPMNIIEHDYYQYESTIAKYLKDKTDQNEITNTLIDFLGWSREIATECSEWWLNPKFIHKGYGLVKFYLLPFQSNIQFTRSIISFQNLSGDSQVVEFFHIIQEVIFRDLEGYYKPELQQAMTPISKRVVNSSVPSEVEIIDHQSAIMNNTDFSTDFKIILAKYYDFNIEFEEN